MEGQAGDEHDDGHLRRAGGGGEAREEVKEADNMGIEHTHR